jgi:hypothetical protein
VEGQIQLSGNASGTITADLEVTAGGTDVVIDHCPVRGDIWQSKALRDPNIAYLADPVAIPDDLRPIELGRLGADDEAVYALVADAREGRLVRFDREPPGVGWTAAVTGRPAARSRVVVGGGLVWVTDIVRDSTHHVVGFDPDDGREVATIQGTSIAYEGDGPGWVVDPDRRVLRRVSDQHRVSDTHSISGKAAGLVAAGSAGVYLVLSGDPRPELVRVDPQTGRVETRTSIRSPRALLADDRAVWVVTDGGVERLDPRSLDELGSVEAELGRFDAVLAPPGMWIARRGLLVALTDELSTRVSIPYLLGPIAPGGGALWMLDDNLGVVRVSES